MGMFYSSQKGYFPVWEAVVYNNNKLLLKGLTLCLWDYNALCDHLHKIYAIFMGKILVYSYFSDKVSDF